MTTAPAPRETPTPAPSPASGRPLKILHVVSSLNVGGLEKFAVRLAQKQREAGQNAGILTLKDGALRAEAEEAGVPVHTLQGGGGRALRMAKGTLLFARERPDIVHAHNPVTLHYALLSKLSGARVALTLHGRGKDDYRPPGEGFWKRVDSIIAVSQYVADDTAHPGFQGRVAVIRNGVEARPAGRRRAEVRAELGLGEAVVGIMVARIDHLKGHDVLLHALAQRPWNDQPFIMLLVGDGAERANRERLARELGLDESRVRFLGFRNDIPDLLAASDLFALPSLSEGLPLSALEAMTFGLPVVASAVGGVPEVVTHEQEGLLFPSKDSEALTQALSRLISDSALRATYGAAGLRRVQTQFSYEGMMHAYDALYRRLCL